MKKIKIKSLKIQLSEYIFFISILVVILSFLLYYLIDLHNIFGLRDYLFSIDKNHFSFFGQSFFFRHWGRNGGLAEIIQFLLLLGSVITSSFIAAYNKFTNKKIYFFWLLMTIAFGLMLIEDAGEIRHTLRYYFQLFFNETAQGTYGTFFEFIYFFLLALIPISALIFYGGFLKKFKKTRIYFVIGFSFYFLASILSHFGTIFLNKENFYDLVGVWFYNFSVKISGPDLAYLWESVELKSFISHYLMDSLVEENIEIIGASAFLAASISFLNNNNKIKNYEKK